MKYFALLLAFFAVALSGCTSDEILTGSDRTPVTLIASTTQPKSYLPMHIGNRWEMNEQNYTVIQDTLRINGELFYYFYSLIGGDGVLRQYLRIDEQSRLVERFPDDPATRVLHADFGAEVGDTFSTLSDDSRNDYTVEVIAKSDSAVTFNYQNKQDDYAHYQQTFVKGLGYEGEYERVVLY